jgi:hypothetical protein
VFAPAGSAYEFDLHAPIYTASVRQPERAKKNAVFPRAEPLDACAPRSYRSHSGSSMRRTPVPSHRKVTGDGTDVRTRRTDTGLPFQGCARIRSGPQRPGLV